MKSAVSPRLLVAGALTALSLVAPVATHAATGTTVKLGKTILGDVLVDSKGMTLYMFTIDKKDESACYEQCAVAWPPLYTEDKPVAGKGVNAELLGTTTRKDGKLQVTYNGLPLYYWFQDKKVGDVWGQDVGEVWYVMNADGKINETEFARVQMSKTPIGNILVGNEGKTLYMFTKDTKNTSTCYDKCAENWPPLTTDVAPIAVTGVSRGLLGTTKRTDGEMQVTYAGMPLYYWAKDEARGDMTGQGVGDVWWVLGTNGKPIQKPAPVATQVALGKTTLGDVLVGPSGMTLYMFDNDTKNTSNCYDQCATNWPPVLTEANPAAAEGLDAKLLGTTTRKDGKLQVTYNGMPLYYWAKDKAAGDTTGQAVGDVWWVVNAAGESVK